MTPNERDGAKTEEILNEYNKARGRRLMADLLAQGLADYRAEIEAPLLAKIASLQAQRDQAIKEISRIGRELGACQAQRDELLAIVKQVADWKIQPYAGARYECLFCGSMTDDHNQGCISIDARAAIARIECADNKNFKMLGE